MTQVNLIGGVLKREIVQQAYAELGQASYEWELTPEEYDVALRRLDAMLEEWRGGYGIQLGYNFPAFGGGSAEDESGLSGPATQIVVGMLAVRLAPTLGKQVSAETRAVLASGWSALRSAFTCVPSVSLDNRTPAGAGNRTTGRGRKPFLAGGGGGFYTGGGGSSAESAPTPTPAPVVPVDPVVVEEQWDNTEW